MRKKGRIYILQDSYPECVDIVSEKYKINEHKVITSKEEFWSNIGHWLALSKSPEFCVDITLYPGKCGLLWWQNGSMLSTAGRINLKEVTDIEYYYTRGEDYDFVFRDIIAEHLQTDNEYIKRAMVDASVFDIEDWKFTSKNNLDIATAGRQLVKLFLSEYLIDYYNYPQMPLEYFLEHYLTDAKIAKYIATKYNLYPKIQVGKNCKKRKSQVLADCVYSIIWAIYEKTKSEEDIKQIVRMMLEDTENEEKNIREIYKKIAEYIKNLSKQTGDTEITKIDYKEMEKQTGIKIDYKILMCTNTLRDFGYIITHVDLNEGVFYLEPSYW